jgi:hypothetical protein
MHWSTILNSLLPILTLLVGLAAKSIVQVIRRVSARVDQLPPWQMRAVAAVVVTGLTIARHFLPGVDLPNSLDGWNVDVVSGLLSLLVAHGTHAAEQPKGVAVVRS